MSKKNGESAMDIASAKTVDAITAERMRLAGLHVPGEVSPEQAAWDREVLKENNTREVAGQLLCHRELTVDEAFAIAGLYVSTAFERMEEIQRRRPAGGRLPEVAGSH